MRIWNRLLIVVTLASALLGLGGCCPELRQVVQKDAVEVQLGASESEKHYPFSLDAPDCFDEGKQPVIALLWKPGKYRATIKLNDLDVALLKEQTCNAVDQAVEALGEAVGGAIKEVVGDLGCMFHLIQGPDFSHDDQVAIQDMRKADSKLEWQLFKLGKNSVTAGANALDFLIERGDDNCIGGDSRGDPKMAYVLISDVDDPCDDKFK